MATGSFGGVFANVLVILSRQNCMRNAPTVGLETRSGIRASSTLRARIERYASREDGDMNVCSVKEGESNFLNMLRLALNMQGKLDLLKKI